MMMNTFYRSATVGFAGGNTFYNQNNTAGFADLDEDEEDEEGFEAHEELT